MAKLALLVALVRPLPPYQEEMRRFPDEKVTAECLKLANWYVTFADVRREAGPKPPWIDDAEEDVLSGRWCQEAWSKLFDYRVYGMRSAAGDLREMLGSDLFFQGRMPPPVPLWRYRSAD